MSKRFYSVLLVFVLLFASCKTLDFSKTSELDNSWKVENSYIQSKNIIYQESLCHLVKIDLSSSDFQLVVFPEKDYQFEENSYFKTRSIIQFVKENNLTVAINASPYESSSRISKKAKILGIHKVENSVFSENVEKYGMICFNGNQIQIVKNQISEEIEKYETVIGGFFVILDDKNCLPYKDIQNARVAIGIDKSENVLYLVLVEGGKGSFYKGLSYNQCATLFLELGCDDALEMDGGTSSRMVLNGKDLYRNVFTKKSANQIGFK